MKARILITISLTGIIICLNAQKPTMTLTFTADNNGQYVFMNNILIENMTQGGDTTLYAPDTILVMDFITGIGNNNAASEDIFYVSQNYPNPIESKTNIDLFLPENENIQIIVSDITGREIIYREYQLDRGNHLFTFSPGFNSLYFLSALTDIQRQTIKMFNSLPHTLNSGICKLEYNGKQSGFDEYKSGNNINNFVFEPGDQLKFTASSNLGEQTITSSPTGDQTYYFHYFGESCPGTPTVIDIEGNEYNTVIIGNQCWMKENLKTTTFNNNTPIPNIADGDDWGELTTAAYVWYDNDSTWKDKYGTLYNWFTMVDTNGLCPTGWHIPKNDELTILTVYIGGVGPPHGNELKSCRQVNSPLAGGCNTEEHPRWGDYSSYHGTDTYGFAGLPGGFRQVNGNFHFLGLGGGWWSSEEYSSSYAWGLGLHVGYSNVGHDSNNKQRGFSVRCLRD